MTDLKTVFENMAPMTPVAGVALRRVSGEQAMIQHAVVSAGAAIPATPSTTECCHRHSRDPCSAPV